MGGFKKIVLSGVCLLSILCTGQSLASGRIDTPQVQPSAQWLERERGLLSKDIGVLQVGDVLPATLLLTEENIAWLKTDEDSAAQWVIGKISVGEEVIPFTTQVHKTCDNAAYGDAVFFYVGEDLAQSVSGVLSTTPEITAEVNKICPLLPSDCLSPYVWFIVTETGTRRIVEPEEGGL